MTLFAGVFARHRGNSLPDGLCETLDRAISRDRSEKRQIARDDRCYVVKIDVGAFGVPAFVQDDIGFAALAGEPLFAQTGSARSSRMRGLVQLHESLAQQDLAPLSRGRGVYCTVQYRRASGSLTLIADKLAIRPLYYWVDDQYVVFATALRVLESVSELRKAMDLRGVTEMAAFGFPLADRSPYTSLRLMMPGEIIDFEDGGERHGSYWRWDDLPASAEPEDSLIDAAYRAFTDGVRLRSGNDTATVAFLSGGLDSRVVVGALRDQGLDVHTFNFALTGTQDQVFGAKYAASAGTIHVEAPMQLDRPMWSMMMADAWKVASKQVTRMPERPRIVWSGDGGSVVAGHVYLDAALVDLARSGSVRDVVEQMNRRWGGEVLRRVLQPSVANSARDATRRGLTAEFERFRGIDAGRRLHLLLLYNDQRRHLAEHFEDIDLHRLEFELPFFDSEFVAAMVTAPVDLCLGHKFYMRWLQRFPASLRSVPWQTYPGHEPCPLPIPQELGYQWAARGYAGNLKRVRRVARLQEAQSVLLTTPFPKPLIRRNALRIAVWLYRLRLRDLGYLFRTVELYSRYWRRSDGRIAASAMKADGRQRP